MLLLSAVEPVPESVSFSFWFSDSGKMVSVFDKAPVSPLFSSSSGLILILGIGTGWGSLGCGAAVTWGSALTGTSHGISFCSVSISVVALWTSGVSLSKAFWSVSVTTLLTSVPSVPLDSVISTSFVPTSSRVSNRFSELLISCSSPSPSTDFLSVSLVSTLSSTEAFSVPPASGPSVALIANVWHTSPTSFPSLRWASSALLSAALWATSSASFVPITLLVSLILSFSVLSSFPSFSWVSSFVNSTSFSIAWISASFSPVSSETKSIAWTVVSSISSEFIILFSNICCFSWSVSSSGFRFCSVFVSEVIIMLFSFPSLTELMSTGSRSSVSGRFSSLGLFSSLPFSSITAALLWSSAIASKWVSLTCSSVPTTTFSGSSLVGFSVRIVLLNLSSELLCSVFSETDSKIQAFCESLSSSELAILRSEEARLLAGIG